MGLYNSVVRQYLFIFQKLPFALPPHILDFSYQNCTTYMSFDFVVRITSEVARNKFLFFFLAYRVKLVQCLSKWILVFDYKLNADT